MATVARVPASFDRRALRRAAHRHRRLLAAGLAAGALAATLGVLAPDPPASTLVVVAAHDLAAGSTLAASDLRTARLPSAVAPDGVTAGSAPLIGRVLATGARRGEPITDVRLVGSGALALGPGLVGAPVRLADAGTAALLTTGAVVDVLAAEAADPVGGDLPTALDGVTAEPAERGSARVVARSARVVVVPDAGPAVAEGSLVVLAVTPDVALELARAAVSTRLSVVLRG